MSSDVDWWARGVAAAGTSLGLVNLWFAQSGSRWKRRHAALAPLESSLREIALPVQNAQDPQVVQAIFTSTSVGAALNELDGAWAKVPDRQFRGWLQKFVMALQVVRGGAQLQPSTPGQQTLSANQKAKLQEADQLLAKMFQRIDKASRKGSG